MDQCHPAIQGAVLLGEQSWGNVEHHSRQVGLVSCSPILTVTITITITQVLCSVAQLVPWAMHWLREGTWSRTTHCSGRLLITNKNKNGKPSFHCMMVLKLPAVSKYKLKRGSLSPSW